MRTYIVFVLIAVDQLLNALIGGYPDETLSSSAWRMRVKGQPYWGWTCGAIDWLALTFFGQADHCQKAFEQEFYRIQLPAHLMRKERP